MGLVDELQESAEKDDVQTVLRKAKRVSSKLGRVEISQWLDNEQNGYPETVKVPDYRRVPVSLCYNTNGYVPAGFGYLKSGIAPLPGFQANLHRPILEPIGTIVAWIEGCKEGKGMYQSVSHEMDARIRDTIQTNFPAVLDQISFLAQLDEMALRDIPEQIKSRVLDWACNLESAGVTGEGKSFSANEKRVAETVIFHINHSSIDQLNASGTNVKRKR